jgi:two-component system phosphate regulon sensor histidine kinase PhoR
MPPLGWVLLAVVTLAAAVLWLQWRQSQARADRAELALAQAEHSLRDLSVASEWYVLQVKALLQAQLEAVLVLATDRTVLDLNPAARALFGQPAESGQTLILVTRSVELDELVAHCLAGGPDCDRRLLLGRNGQPYRARAVLAGRPDLGEGAQGVVLWLQDLSELQRLGRARRDFVANISHELRTPITSIRLLVDTLRGPMAHDAQARAELLEKISVETETLAQLSQELLDLAQIESGQALMRLVPVAAADIVGVVTRRLGPQAERKRQSLHVEVPTDVLALADEAQAARALGNLLHNAIKFTPAEGEIWIRARAVDGDVLFEVADTGPGIPADDIPRVFERFFRGDRARSSGGTGLGLAIAKHVVEAHGGRIWVEAGGRGATFQFALPRAEQRLAETPAPSSQPPPP